MSERGPVPQPVVRRRNKREENGQFRAAPPVMPDGLSEEAKREWRRIVPPLREMGVLSTIDRAVLVRYCTVWADWVELDAQVALSGRVIHNRGGDVVRNPLWLARREAEAMLVELGRLLMLSPATRLRSGIKHEAPVAAGSGITALAWYRERLAQ